MMFTVHIMFLEQTSQDVLIFSTGQSAFSRPSDHWCSSAVMENESILLYMCHAVHLLLQFCVLDLFGEHDAAGACLLLWLWQLLRTYTTRWPYLYVSISMCMEDRTKYHLRKITRQCIETIFIFIYNNISIYLFIEKIFLKLLHWL